MNATNEEVWVLGATGRTGRAIVTRLHEAGVPLVLVGRDRGRLEGVAAGLGGAPRLLAGTLESALAGLARQAPAVVINTIGPFARTAPRVARACPPGTHYLDIANDVEAARAILDLDREAAETGRVFVTGAGFGVLATESVVLRLCEDRPPASRVRVDAVASVATEDGVLGSALASTIVDGLPSGGRRVRRGRLARARLGTEPARLTTPDGDTVTTASIPSGELLAAWRASGADSVVAASSEVPTGAAARLLIPAASALLRVPPLARFAAHRIARIHVRAQDRPRTHSWARARVEWPSGEVREGWLRAGDGHAFTAADAAEVAQRLLRGEGRPGTHTPGALFGPELAEAVGGEFFVEQVDDRDRESHVPTASRTSTPSAANARIRDPMPTNTAAWLPAKRAKLEVGPAPYTHPREDEIAVENRAVAVNIVDWNKQVMGDLMFSWIKYPFVLGEDVAGDVLEVGSNVTRFKVGDRVLGHAVGADKKRNNPAEGAFQEYTVLLARMAAPIPASMTYEEAAVLPLAVSTAACGLFQKDHLALRYPSATPNPTGETLLVWGGSTSVGSNAIQLAVAAGYEVVTTSSPRNFDYVKKLGASRVFDYNSETVVEDVIAAFQGKTLAGALAIGNGSAQACSDVVYACRGNKFVSIATPPASLDELPKGAGAVLRFVLRFAWSTASLAVKTRARRVRTKSIFGSTLMDNEVGRLVYEDFLPQALADGRYVAAPDPYIVGKGLEHVQTGFDVQRGGVSAKKVVVSL